MSKSQSKMPVSPRSEGAPITPRRSRTRRTLSVASPARSDASGRLSSVVEKFIKNEKFTMSPMTRNSILPDDTEIEAPRRASWWKRLEGSSRDVLEALDTNKMPDDLLVADYEFEIEKDKEKTVSECSDNESVASIVVPQRRLFNQKRETQGKFGDMIGSRKSLGRTNIEDISIDDAPKNLFNKGPRNRPVFPAALLNSTNKTINKTVEPEPSKPNRPNLFGQAGTKRKNMFTDFVLSESEEDSEVQPKVFGFKQYDNKRMSLGTRNRRKPSLTPSMTTEIDIDDWNLLPSSTMIGAPEVSRIITDEDMAQIPNENQDDTLTEDNTPLKADAINKSKFEKSLRGSDENDRTLTNEGNESTSKHQQENYSKQLNKTHEHSKTKLRDSVKENITKNASLKSTEGVIENIHVEQELSEHGTLIEDKMAEIHGESIVPETKSQHRESLSNAKYANASNRVKNLLDVEPNAVEERNQNSSKRANSTNQEKDLDNEAEKNKSEEKIEPSAAEQEKKDSAQGECNTNEEEGLVDVSEKDKSEDEMEPSAEEQESQDSSKEANITNQDEELEDESEKDESEKEIEPSAEEQESQSQESSKEASNTNQDEDKSEKEKSYDEMQQASSQVQESRNSSKEISDENQDEEMEEMVWNDNDDEKQSEDDETCENAEAKHNDENVENDVNHDQIEAVSITKNITNKSHKIVESSVNDDQMDQDNDVVDETPDNSTQDTTGRNRKKEETHVKSPEAVLQNMTKDNESFRPIGRSTSFRKSKSVIGNINIRPCLATVQESTLGSDGSRNSSTEGSGWDSHRTTRKTIRQTFGKDFTPRKSLRALVMEQSAKRQTEVYDKLNKTKNKTVSEDKNTSKANKTKNNSVMENTSKTNKGKIKTYDDIDNHVIRDRKISNRYKSIDELPHSKSPSHEPSTHHVSDPLISKLQVSYDKSAQDLNESEMSEQQIPHREESVDIPMDANNDSGPEISIHASYGQGMSREASDHHEEEQTLGHKISLGIKEISRRDASARIKSSHVTDQEVLDYEASDQEDSVQEISEIEDNEESKQENSEHEASIHVQEGNSESENEVEIQESEHESEVEESRQEDGPESEEAEEENESELEQEVSQQDVEIESYQEESQQEIEAESDQEELEQEIEADSDQEESQQDLEAESDQEESQQDIEAESDQEESQKDIEAESDQEESQQDMEVESAQEESDREENMSHENAQSDQESIHNISEDQESEHSDQDENNEHSDQLVSGLNSQYHMSNSNRTERVVFDNEISEQEIDYELSERVSRQLTDNDISDQVSETEATPEITRSRVTEHSAAHDVSIGTKKSMLLMQMQKIMQQNMEMKQKIRESVQNSLKPSRNFNKMSPIQSKFPIRRITKTEPKKPKAKPKPKNIPIEALPKDFVEDLMYKPPKRFQPANAPWITKRLYKFLETKLEPKYDYRARVRAEELVQTIHSFTKLVRRRDLAPPNAVDELKREMARLKIVTTHFEFYEFFHDFMPREIRIKVNPDVVNKIPTPRNGIFSDILPARVAVE